MILAGLGHGCRVFVYRGACDMCRSFDRLALMVTEELKEDPLSGDWFLFLSQDKRRLKALYWDTDGYALWYKRLERGRFVLPDGEDTAIDKIGLTHLLEGVKARIMSRQPRFRRENYKIVDKELDFPTGRGII